MNFWIRSQDKKRLILVNSLRIEKTIKDKKIINPATRGVMITENSSIYSYDDCLGQYETEERSLEILNEIQKLIDRGIKFSYTMPEK